jgi:hypothetical protein
LFLSFDPVQVAQHNSMHVFYASEFTTIAVFLPTKCERRGPIRGRSRQRDEVFDAPEQLFGTL